MKRATPNPFWLVILISLFPALSFAQTNDSTAKSEKTQFLTGLTYTSAMNYYGRVDSLKSTGISPFIGISFKNGLYLNSTFVFVHNTLQSQYAATLVEGGYNFKDKNQHWAGTISASKYFYQSGSDLVQSAVRESAAVSGTYLNKIIDITLGGDVKYSNSADFGLQAGIDHIIRIQTIFGNDVIVFDPSAYIYSGTQNFTQSYYEHKNVLFIPVTQQQVTQTSRHFNVLAYELSLPIVYGYKKMNIILSPAYVIPENVITVAGEPNLSEKADKLFYFTASIKFTL